MTWQDELQHLDAELAAGRISAEEYRQRRDTALGRAQSEQPGSPPTGSPEQGQPGTPAGGFAGQGQQNPFPPAFNWGQAVQQGNQAAQQGNQPPQPPGSENSTQVVQNPMTGQQPGQPPASPPPAGQDGGESESTQIVNVNHVQPPAPQSPQQGWGQPPQGWGQQPPSPQQGQPAWGPQQNWGATADGGTPWGDSDLPPEHGDTSWMRQGPEVFETAGKSSRGMILGLSVGGLLVVGLIVAGCFYFLSSGDSGSPQARDAGTEQQRNPPPPPPTPTSEPLPEPPPALPAPPADPAQVLIPAPPGPPHAFTGLLPPQELQGAKAALLNPSSVRDFALRNGMVDGWFNGNNAPVGSSLLAVRMPDQAKAAGLAQAYLDSQKGLSTVEELSYQGVEVVSTGKVFRTAYTSHNWTIIVDVHAPDGQGSAARALFKDVLDQQLAKMPPTVRK